MTLFGVTQVITKESLLAAQVKIYFLPLFQVSHACMFYFIEPNLLFSVFWVEGGFTESNGHAIP